MHRMRQAFAFSGAVFLCCVLSLLIRFEVRGLWHLGLPILRLATAGAANNVIYLRAGHPYFLP